jgi:hypothetical protein
MVPNAHELLENSHNKIMNFHPMWKLKYVIRVAKCNQQDLNAYQET